jgi:outer membrane lipoprotein-sorting protein
VSISSDANQILREVVKQYAAFDSYADNGTVRRLADAGNPERTIDFATLFRRPSHFRFEVRRPHPYPPLGHVVSRLAIVSDGAAVRYLQQKPQEPLQIETKESLGVAIAALTGVSHGSVHTIGRLLIPEVTGLSLLDLTDARLEADATIGQSTCYRIAARHPWSGDRMEVWVDKRSWLIRKKTTYHDGFQADEVRENVRVNERLDEALFDPNA